MMRTAGVFLIFAAVALRGIVLFSTDPDLLPLLGLLAAYGLFLAAATWFTHHKPRNPLSPLGRWWALAYLLIQSAIVLLLLVVSTYEDFFALLFIPLSLDAVAFFGRRWGFIGIAAMALAMLGAFQYSDEGKIFGLAMGVLYSGICFLFGGYAYQVQKAAAARDQNQRTFDQLQIAHRQLQGYADQVTSLAVEHERNRLARDLHDSVTQTVFSMNLIAQSTRLLLERDPPRAVGQLLRIEDLAANALAEIQSLVAQLHPRSVTEEGLPTALRRLAAERQERDGLQIALEVIGDQTLSSAEAAGLYAIAQEALTNIAKHSGVREATVRLDLKAGASCLEIEDRGAGFDTQAAPHQRGHLGLAGMAERAHEIGWRLAVESRRDQGTRIRVTEGQAASAVLSQGNEPSEVMPKDSL